MNSGVLTYAVRLVRVLVDDVGETRPMTVQEASTILGLIQSRTNEVIESLQEAGYVTVGEDRVRPTTAGLALAARVASAIRQIQRHQMSARGPYWTYIPTEVTLSG